jgi:hypothetical protein
VLRTDGVISYRDTLNALIIEFPTNLAAGLYQATVRAPLADLAGNQLATVHLWTFRVISGVDSDHDGVPDAVELLLGLNPFSSDSLGDGTRDGDRDFDRDGLSNAGEVLLGADPRNPHTFDPNMLDGDPDGDQDSLTDGQEVRLGTTRSLADSDGDGWNDESEATAGSDPLSADSTPELLEIARPALTVSVTGEASLAGFDFGLTIIAKPLLTFALTFADGFTGGDGGTTVAEPPVSIEIKKP